MLFTGTIADNLRYGKSDASLDELKHAATVAQSYDFIMEKPQGFDEMITESATKRFWWTASAFKYCPSNH